MKWAARPSSSGSSSTSSIAAIVQRQQQWRHSMLATSTHDTKRSEDVRMRLDVLSEMPRLWAAQVLRWRRSNRGKKRTLSDGRTVPDANEEYLLYQTLVGTWPLPAEEADASEWRQIAETAAGQGNGDRHGALPGAGQADARSSWRESRLT